MYVKKSTIKVTPTFITTLFTFAILIGCNKGSSSSYDHTTWTHYAGSPDQSKYFNASQITKRTVGQMEVAWVYPSGDNLPYFFSPIIVDTTMYLMAKNFSLVAVNVLTHKEIWIHSNLMGLTRRGLNYWESKDKRISA